MNIFWLFFPEENATIRYLNILISFDIFHFIGYKSGCLELGNFPPTEAFTARLTLCAGVTKVETFAEKLERLDAEAAEQSMTNAGFVAQIAQVVEGNARGDTEKTAYDDAKLEVTEYFSIETDAGALSM